MVPEETKNKNSAAKLRANNRYAKDKYEEIKFRVRRGEKDKLMQYAREHDYSLNAFIYDAVCHYRQYLDEAISDQNAEERIVDSAIADAPLSLSLNNENSYSVVNLFAGMGSMSLAFAQAGFDVIRAYEQDHAACEMFRSLFGSERLTEGDIRNCDIDDIPSPDVLAIEFPKISTDSFADIHDTECYLESVFGIILKIIEKKFPYIVYFELDEEEPIENIDLAGMSNDEIFIRSNLSGMKKYFYEFFIDKLTELHYEVKVNSAHKACDVSELSQSGKKRYLIAVNEEVASLFYMLPSIPVFKPKPAVEVIRQNQKQNEFYYYRNSISFDRYVISSVQSRHMLYRIHLSKVFGCPDGMCPALNAGMINKRNTVALRDDFGVRQLTPGEYLMFKGCPESVRFPKELSLEDRYRLAGSCVNVPITENYAQSIKSFLDLDTREPMIKMAEHMNYFKKKQNE
ncbi:DNA cytosine methyltransferase [uncultured Ruminococcus sp.]|uniref:DNA cytosine methyltransferase n=1 Tax=uncultured Ruminococcus sp. TaxID=165186 RepID=UPI00292CFB6A|nr:DNA cytosine methyltransferase [uncultured Ruminococcus sp.]